MGNRQLGGIFLIFGWLILISLSAYLVHKSVFSPKSPRITNQGGQLKIILYRDHDAHFRIRGSINGVEQVFLIDTGASTIAVSDSVATAANLPRKSRIGTHTAAGPAYGYLSSIENLKIEQIELNNITAIIVPQMSSDQALLGMNVLSKFRIEQTADTLTISLPP